MKKLIHLVLTTTMLIGGSAYAQTPYLTKENVGRAIGAGVGALVGSQIGGGKGKLAAVAAGTLTGYWVGGKIGRHLSQSDRRGLAYNTQQALYTGQPSTWRNPDTGVVTKVSVRDSSYRSSTKRRVTTKPRLTQVPPLEMIGDFYIASKISNVRGGPGTEYTIVDKLNVGEKVPVVGKVIGEDWVMVAENGVGYGFVYAPLLTRIWSDQASANAIRIDDSYSYAQHSTPVQTQRCSYVTQEIILPDGTRSAKDIQACQKGDGSWEAV